MGRVPLLIPLIALLAGIIVGGEWPELFVLFISISLVVSVCLWLGHRHAGSVSSLFFGIGVLAVFVTSDSEPELPGGERIYSAYVVSVREESGSRRIKCKVDGVGVVNLRLYGAFPIVREGNSISFSGLLTPYEKPEGIVPDELVFADNDVVAECVVTDSNLSVADSGLALRRKIIDLILDSGVGDRTGAMLCALLIGESEYLPANVRTGFSAAGIAHVLALSGLHVGVITALIALMLWPLYVGRHNRTRRVLTIMALWGYAALTGFSPSVTRAVIMASVYMFGRVLERPGVPMNSLCLAAIVILLMDPASVWSISFQLSFAAVAGILIFYPVFNFVDHRSHPWLYRLVGYPAVSVSAMIFTGILSAYYFHSYPLFFLVANLAISPLIPLIIGGGTALVLFNAVGFQVGWLCHLLDWLTDASCGIADMIRSIPGHVADGLYFSPLVIIPAFAAILILGRGLYSRRAFHFIAALALIVLTFQTHLITAAEVPTQEHYFLHDKVATNVLIRDNDRLYLLTSAKSTGLQADILRHGEYRFRNYMERRGIDKLHLCPDTLLTEYFSRTGDYFSIDGQRYMFLKDNHNPEDDRSLRLDYLIVARGFTGNVVRSVSQYEPDSAVILSSALDKRRMNRYAEELEDSNIKYLIE